MYHLHLLGLEVRDSKQTSRDFRYLLRCCLLELRLLEEPMHRNFICNQPHHQEHLKSPQRHHSQPKTFRYILKSFHSLYQQYLHPPNHLNFCNLLLLPNQHLFMHILTCLSELPETETRSPRPKMFHYILKSNSQLEPNSDSRHLNP